MENINDVPGIAKLVSQDSPIKMVSRILSEAYEKAIADAAWEVPMSLPHATRPVQVWVDADLGIADLVEYLNAIPGVRTEASCQGGYTYRAYVLCTWTPEALRSEEHTSE